jgi:hypothetical protein
VNSRLIIAWFADLARFIYGWAVSFKLERSVIQQRGADKMDESVFILDLYLCDPNSDLHPAGTGNPQ